MKKAREKYKIGDHVQILVHNSHYLKTGEVCGFDITNEYNLKVMFDEGRYIQGYMTNDVRHIPRTSRFPVYHFTQERYKEIRKYAKNLFNIKI